MSADLPKRIQRKRTKGWRMPEGAVYVGRPTAYGNPFEVGGAIEVAAYRDGDVRSGEFFMRHIVTPFGAVKAFQFWVEAKGMESAIRQDLAGRDLACWCPLDQPCHADVLLEIANREQP